MPGESSSGTRVDRAPRRGLVLVFASIASIACLVAACQRAGRESALAPEAPPLAAGEIFALSCAHCHTGPALGAPRIGHPEEWNARDAKDLETLLARTVSGHGDMPPLGGCGYCSENDLRGVIALMVAGSEIGADAAEASP